MPWRNDPHRRATFQRILPAVSAAAFALVLLAVGGSLGYEGAMGDGITGDGVGGGFGAHRKIINTIMEGDNMEDQLAFLRRKEPEAKPPTLFERFMGKPATVGKPAKNSKPPAAVDSTVSLNPSLISSMLVVCFLIWGFFDLRRRIRGGRALKRPYALHDTLRGHIPNPEEELCKIVTYVQDTVIVPIDSRLPGRPFEFDLHSFPFTPMVLVIGNHSSGKSTFINWLLGMQAQETGVAPTDDGFTVLERRETESQEDGPTVLSCPENRPYKDLQRFGQAFSGHFRRKRKTLPEDSILPFGLQIVDTPGMIDLPVAMAGGNTEFPPAPASNSVRGRGYNFVEVVRWWAKRADLILLLFDPDKPGTTGETLEVLTKSLAGLDHKFLVLLNKVDQLDNSVDFARAYGTLGWALSKVIRRKDIPNIYTMYNAGFCADMGMDHKLPLENFAKRRDEVVTEVLRSRERHFDNVVTSLEETLRQVSMAANVLGAIRQKSMRRLIISGIISVLVAISPAGALTFLLQKEIIGTERITTAVVFGMVASYVLLLFGVMALFQEYMRQFSKLQKMFLDEAFEDTYAEFFIHNDGEDHRNRWDVVKPKIMSILHSINFAAELPPFPKWETQRIDEVLRKDIWQLRQLARLLRVDHGGPSGVAPPRDSGGRRHAFETSS